MKNENKKLYLYCAKRKGKQKRYIRINQCSGSIPDLKSGLEHSLGLDHNQAILAMFWTTLAVFRTTLAMLRTTLVEFQITLAMLQATLPMFRTILAIIRTTFVAFWTIFD